MAFMISKETENVQSSQEIENAFRAITAADRPYVTKEELYAVSIFRIFHICDDSPSCVMLLTFGLSFAEPHERDGRLLCGEDETVRRSENGEAHNGRLRLHRVHAYAIPKLIYMIYFNGIGNL